MKTQAQIEKEIETLEGFVLKHARIFNEHGSGFLGGKIEALQWVIENG